MSDPELLQAIAFYGGLFFLVTVVGFVIFYQWSKRERIRRARDVEIYKARNKED